MKIFKKIIILILFLFLFNQFSLIKPLVAQTPATNTTNNIDLSILGELIRLLFSLGFRPQGGNLPDLTPIPGNVHSGANSAPSAPAPYNPGPIPFTPPSGYVYYSQCGASQYSPNPYKNKDFGGYSLPNGCNICKAGCGPTTVSMILGSLVNKSITPEAVVDYYGSTNLLKAKIPYYLGCDGSRASDAQAALNNLGGSYGLKTTAFRLYNSQSVGQQVANDFRNWLRSGWTIFALANYCENGCGHFFWII